MFEFHPSKVATVKNDVLSGLTVALALVPEAVAFAFVAGVDPLSLPPLVSRKAMRPMTSTRPPTDARPMTSMR